MVSTGRTLPDRRAAHARAALATLALAMGLPAQLRVVTTIPDFADVARSIGGDAVAAESLTNGDENLHLVRIRPSLVIKLRRADALITLGFNGEHAWVPALLRTARNSRVRAGQPGFLNASKGITPLRVPKKIDRGQGPDLHPNGNPHYNLDPERMRIAVRNIRDLLIRLDPPHARRFRTNCKAWESQLDVKLKLWRKQLAPFKGAAFLEGHDTWVYFAERFGLRIAQRLEPKPGQAPTPSHLALVMKVAKAEHVGLVVGRPLYRDVARRVAKQVGAKAVLLQSSSSKTGPNQGWFHFMDGVVATFSSNLRRPGRQVKRTTPAPIRKRP